ncbi:MAG: hypothetical protein JWR61_4035 [Ferruginibacter sp.]|nr:hypothetical protein [Ferruginibacter sp.]
MEKGRALGPEEKNQPGKFTMVSRFVCANDILPYLVKNANGT